MEEAKIDLDHGEKAGLYLLNNSGTSKGAAHFLNQRYVLFQTLQVSECSRESSDFQGSGYPSRAVVLRNRLAKQTS